MPRYELMYILASTVSDDQLPKVTEQVVQYVKDFGGSDVEEMQMGKKKLAYPIKKTRNGFYGLVTFTLEGKKLAALDAKIRTQDATIIRYIIVNLDEHLARLAKDKAVQAKLGRQIPATESSETTTPATAPAVVAEKKTEEEKPEKKPARKSAKKAADMNEEELDKKIEEALSEDLLK